MFQLSPAGNRSNCKNDTGVSQHYCRGACQISKWLDDVITRLSLLRLCETKDVICDTESVDILINFHVQILLYFAILASFYCYISLERIHEIIQCELIDR